MNRKLVEIKELPRRARSLTETEIQSVFGGCASHGPCKRDKDCCDTHKCDQEDNAAKWLGFPHKRCMQK
jgi:hypothetical protein